MPPPPPDSRGYDSLPPIPSYDEAVSTYTTPSESQSFLNRTAPASRRHPGGYRQPTVETDDEESLFGSSSDDGDGDRDRFDDDDENLVRREMQELDMDEPDRPRTLWGKTMAFSLPKWKWAWRLRLPKFQIRLPSGPPEASSSSSPPSASDNPAETNQDGSTTAPSRFAWFSKVKFGAESFALVARLIAMFLIFGFLYLVFSGTLVSTVTNGMGGLQPSPEALRNFILENVDPRKLRLAVKHYTRYAHLAGTEGSRAMATDMKIMFHRAGLHGVTLDEYDVYLNYPRHDGRLVQLLDDKGEKAVWTAPLEEQELGGELSGRQTWNFHAYSKSGDVKGPLIYANYGDLADFQKLVDMGIDPKGAIALVRVGGPQQNVGLKVKAAETFGFVGCLVYTDPSDNGIDVGPTAPDGRYMPIGGVQRDTVALPNFVLGDPLTPGWASKSNTLRLARKDAEGVVGIPSIGLSAQDVQPLLQRLTGVGLLVPDGWSGATTLNPTWWTGNVSASPIVRLKNEQDEDMKHRITNVYGKLPGYEQTAKSIIIGNQRDALAFGATDPASGTAVLIEMARLFGILYEDGWRPLRTIEFMSWDAEAYNYVGSTEFVEHNIKALREDAYAYISLDKAVLGNELHATGSPIFYSVLSHVLQHIDDPNQKATLQELWQRRQGRIEPPGATGSFAAFQHLAGTSSLELSFSGTAYPRHSSYDNFQYVDTVGDPGWVYHTLMARIVGVLLVELADRHVLPLDLVEYGDSVRNLLFDLDQWVAQAQRGADASVDSTLSLAALHDAGDKLREVAARYDEWSRAWHKVMLTDSWYEDSDTQKQRWVYNERLCEFETMLLDLEFEGGIPNRPQFRHVVFGPSLWSTQGDASFPAIRAAVEAADWDRARRLVNSTATLITLAADTLTQKGPSSDVFKGRGQ